MGDRLFLRVRVRRWVLYARACCRLGCQGSSRCGSRRGALDGSGGDDVVVGDIDGRVHSLRAERDWRGLGRGAPGVGLVRLPEQARAPGDRLRFPRIGVAATVLAPHEAALDFPLEPPLCLWQAQRRPQPTAQAPQRLLRRDTAQAGTHSVSIGAGYEPADGTPTERGSRSHPLCCCCRDKLPTCAAGRSAVRGGCPHRYCRRSGLFALAADPAASGRWLRSGGQRVVGSLAACRRRKNEAIGAAPMSGRFRLCKTSARPLRSATPACRFRQTAADDGLAGWGLLAAFEDGQVAYFADRSIPSCVHAVRLCLNRDGRVTLELRCCCCWC
mmetsp:Transcript_76242/g.246739  ORF Transcript_76242/g.246739 Transcript_76242/m.246739 type:complete len:329 (+) Transcript_76242:377-1363(+)